MTFEDASTETGAPATTAGEPAEADEMGGAPWFRLHARLVSSGTWAALKPCSRTVLVVLASLLDNRKRMTYAGVERVAGLAGLSTARTMFAYKELRERGLIWRRRVRVGRFWPYESGLTNPARWRGGD